MKKIALQGKYGKGKVDLYSNGQKYYFGVFGNEHHAALVYDLWAKDLHGQFARLNFKHLSYEKN